MSRPSVAERALLLAEVRRRLRWPADPDRALARLRRHAARRSPLLAERLAGTADAPLAALPVLTKDDLVDRFDELVTDRSLRHDQLQRHVDTQAPGTRYGRYRVGASSGSSGRPALLPADRWEWAAKLANSARAQALTGASTIDGPRRVARIASPSAWHLSAQVGTTLADPRRPTLRLPATTSLDELGDAVERFGPTIISGYASVLGALAHRQLAGDLAIRPRRVLSAGEPLTAGIRAAIEEAWGVAPHDQYATTEAGFVAAECDAHAGMHVLGEDVVVEVVDADDRSVPAGEVGAAVLVSVLASRTLPLLRYRLDDTVALDRTRCPCGRPGARLRIEGRERELLPLAPAASVHPVVVTQVLDRQPVGAWQVRHEVGALEVLVAGARPGLDLDAVRGEVEAAVRAAVAGPVVVTIRAVDSIDRAAGGKAARFVPRS